MSSSNTPTEGGGKPSKRFSIFTQRKKNRDISEWLPAEVVSSPQRVTSEPPVFSSVPFENSDGLSDGEGLSVGNMLLLGQVDDLGNFCSASTKKVNDPKQQRAMEQARLIIQRVSRAEPPTPSTTTGAVHSPSSFEAHVADTDAKHNAAAEETLSLSEFMSAPDISSVFVSHPTEEDGI
jgi:hypothetical protein